jgi:hypothetical protein
MRKTTVKAKCERLADQAELYYLTFYTHNEKLEVKVDKENLRHLIEILDNEII